MRRELMHLLLPRIALRTGRWCLLALLWGLSVLATPAWAQAAVYRNRWYGRDERRGRAIRTWRLAYQPLTASWRLSLGGLSQGYDSLSEALAPLTRVSGWHLLALDKIEPGERYYVEFSFKLDNSQLPQPMQIDLGGDWKLSVERSLRVE